MRLRSQGLLCRVRLVLRWGLWVLGLAVLLVACTRAEGGSAATGGTVAPDLPIALYQGADALGGSEIQLSALQGKAVVLNFWAGLCPPCRAEMPTMDALQRELGEDLVILPLSLDRDGAALVRAYYDDHDLTTLPVMIDEKMAAGRALRVHGIPATVFINREGAEVARVLGDRDWSDPAVIELVRHIID